MKQPWEERAKQEARARATSTKLKAPAKAAATKALQEKSMHFRHTDLSKEVMAEIRHLHLGLKGCSRCRWQTGCFSWTTSTSSPTSCGRKLSDDVRSLSRQDREPLNP